MTWTGEVWRHFYAVKPAGGGSIVLFDCGHEQRSKLTPEQILKSCKHPAQIICETCSDPQRARIEEIRQSISFDEVLKKIEHLASG